MLTRILQRPARPIVYEASAPRPLQRRDFYIGVALVALAILAHAYIPRYDVSATSSGSRYQRIDRWTGHIEVYFGASSAPAPSWVTFIVPHP